MLNLAAPLVLSLLSYYVVAQSTVKATCGTGYPWTFNSLNQSPCDVGAALAGVCIGGGFTLSALDPGYVYLGPDASNANQCRCSSVYYSLLAACSVCQTRNFIRWSQYKANCTTVYSQVFPQPIPSGIAVPHYAYLDVEANDSFNVTVAQAAGGPESTRLPSSTGVSSPTAATAGSNVSTSSSKKTNVGAIAGGVVGGVVGLALIGGLIFWLLRRRAKFSSAPSFSRDPGMAQNPASLGGASYTSSPAQKIYDPNDPATFPSGFPSSDGYSLPYASSELQQQNQSMYSNRMVPTHTGTTTTSFPPVRPQYSGAPEL